MAVLDAKKPTAIDMAILQHIARYRLTVPEAIVGLPECRQFDASELASRFRALEEASCISSTWLYSQRRCYTLTTKGAIRVRRDLADVDPNAALSETTKIRRFATLSFCCLTKIRRHRLTAAELAENAPTD